MSQLRSNFLVDSLRVVILKYLQIINMKLAPIPTGNGLNQHIYSYHVTQAGRNRVKIKELSLEYGECFCFAYFLENNLENFFTTYHD